MAAEIAISIITIVLTFIVCFLYFFYSPSYKQMEKDIEDIKEMRKRTLEIEKRIRGNRSGKGIR